MFNYCPQCGLISGTAEGKCPVCAFGLENVPADYLSANGNLFKSAEVKKAFVAAVIESGEMYIPELAQQRDSILAEKNKNDQERIEKLVAEYRNTKPVHKCPVCSSHNLSKISNIGKVTKIALIGVWGAGDLGKQWRCNSCGYKF